MISMLILPSFVHPEEMSFIEKFQWLRQTFEENDAGFQHAIDCRGWDEYEKHNKIIEEKVREAKSLEEAVEVYNEWLRFFRKGHCWVSINPDTLTKHTMGKTEPQIVEQWETCEISGEDLKNYLATLKKPDFEGIWVSEPYTIGIKKQENEYIGFIIDGGETQWQKQQVKMRIMQTEKQAGYRGIWYMADYSPRYFDEVKLIGNNYITMGWIYLERVYPEYSEDEDIRFHFELITTKEPLVKRLNNNTNTLLLRIPSFEYSQKRKIDSLLAAYHNEIITTENLIIDLRNNGGGTDMSWRSLIPYMYTNPIRTVTVEYLSGLVTIRMLEEHLKDPNFPEEIREWERRVLEKIKDNPGEFINLSDSLVFITEMDTIYEYPKDIAIIINENCGSATEQFLLSAKQSKKVKLYGRTTYGSLDTSNLFSVDSPDGEIKLAYAASRSLRLPEMPIDGIGIQPDFYIDRSIPEYKWVNFVESILAHKVSSQGDSGE
jgi:hypothetical protein